MADEDIRRNAEEHRATVVFADLLGFTAISDRVGAEQAYAHVTTCIKLLDGILRRHGGSVDKNLGDSIVAMFGYPVPRKDAAWAAVRAALQMRQCIEEYNRESGLETPVGICIGINTGPMLFGDVHGPVFREFNVLGDTVNTAARLKSLAPAGATTSGPRPGASCRITSTSERSRPSRLRRAPPIPDGVADPGVGSVPRSRSRRW